MTTAAVLTYVYSERFEAESKLRYRPQEVTRLRGAETQAFGSPVPAAPFKVINQTVGDLLRSRVLLEPLVRDFQLDRADRNYVGHPLWIWLRQRRDEIKDFGTDLWMWLKFGRSVPRDRFEGALEDLAAAVKVRNKDSYVYQIIVRDRDPDRAAALANRIASDLVLLLRESARAPGAQQQAQIERLIEDKTREITATRQQMRALYGRELLASIQTESDKSIERLSALDLERARLRAEIERSDRRLRELDEQRRSRQRVLGAAAVAAEQVAQLPRAATATVGPEPTPADAGPPVQAEDFRRLNSERLFEGIEIEGLRAKLKRLDDEATRVERQLRRVPALATQRDELAMRLEALQTDYLNLSAALQEAVVRATAMASEISILDQATPQHRPVSPIKIYHIGLTAVLSILMACGLVYMLSYFNIRLLFPSLGAAGRRGATADAP